MRLINFRSRRLNGYLDFDLDLSRDLSFLIGINGSGKTTVLRAIMALLGPDLGWLNNTKFDFIGLHFHHEGYVNYITAAQDSSGTRISVSVSNETSDFLVTDDLISKLSRQEEEYTYDDDGNMIIVRETQVSVPDRVSTFRTIRSLPAPVFLGLDRSTLPLSDHRNSARNRARAARRGHATLRTFLDESVAQAEQLAVIAGRSAVLERSRRAAVLREKVLLSLFSDIGMDRNNQLPKPGDLKKYEATRRSLKQAFSVLGIPGPVIGQSIDPFFTNVIERASSLTKYKDASQVWGSGHENTFFEWLDLTPRLGLLYLVESLIKEFNADERKIFERIRRYEDILNSFLYDSHKRVSFTEDGELVIEVPSSDNANVFFLSSGERQLFVLITNLMFNNDSQQADILIIDEPELSLHIKWQEMFVDSLQQANSDIQIILATHSPSIISDRVENCVDLV